MVERHTDCNSPPRTNPPKTGTSVPKRGPSGSVLDGATSGDAERQPPCQPAESYLSSAADAFQRMAAALRNTPELPDLDDLDRIPGWVVELVLDRIDAGFRERLFIMDEANYAGLLACLMPDEFVIPPEPAKATPTPPGSGGSVLNGTRNESARVRVYVKRCRDQVSLYHRLDAKGDQFDRGIRPVWEGNQEAKAGGWVDERPKAKKVRRRRAS